MATVEVAWYLGEQANDRSFVAANRTQYAVLLVTVFRTTVDGVCVRYWVFSELSDYAAYRARVLAFFYNGEDAFLFNRNIARLLTFGDAMERRQLPAVRVMRQIMGVDVVIR